METGGSSGVVEVKINKYIRKHICYTIYNLDSETNYSILVSGGA